MRASASKHVDASAEQVWALLADHEGMSDWGPVTVTIDKAAAMPGGVGTVRRIHTAGPAPDLVEEITCFDPGERLGYKSISGVPLKNYRGTVELAAAGSGTQVTWTLEADSPLPGVALKPVAVGLLSLLVRQARKRHG